MWRKLAGLVSVVLVLALLVAVAMRSTLLEAVLRGELESHGIGPVELHVTAFGWDAIRIEGLRVGDALSVDSIKVSFGLPRLLRGLIDAVGIVGADLDVSHPETGLIAAVRREIASLPATGGQSFPLPNVTFRDCVVHAARKEGAVRARFEGEIKPDRTARIGLFEGDVSAPGIKPLHMSGQAQYDGTQLTAALSAKPESGHTAIQVRLAFAPGDRRAEIELAPTTFKPGGLQPGDLVPALDTLSPASATVRARAVAVAGTDGLTARIRLNVGDMGLARKDMRLADGSFVADIDIDASAKAFQLRLAEGKATISGKGQSVRLENVRAHGGGSLDGRDVHLTLDTASIKTPWITPTRIAGQAVRAGDALDFSLRADDKHIAVAGRHRLDTGAGQAEVHAGPWRFTDGGLQPRDLSPRLAAIDKASGGLGADLDFRWGGNGVSGKARVKIDRLTVKSGALSVEGLSGDVRFDDLTPPVTKAVQTLTARRIGGVLGLTDPQLEFRLDDSGKLYVAHAEGGIAGGAVTLDRQTIDPRASSQSLTLAFSRLDLARLFGLLNVEGVSGRGRLSGSVPLVISADAVTIADAGLSAVGPGILKLRSAAARRALAGAGKDAALLLDVLSDFHYRRLDLHLNKDAGGSAIIRLSTAGQNPAVMDGHPFVLNVNLTTRLDQLAKVLSTALRLSQQALLDTLKALRTGAEP